MAEGGRPLVRGVLGVTAIALVMGALFLEGALSRQVLVILRATGFGFLAAALSVPYVRRPGHWWAVAGVAAGVEALLFGAYLSGAARRGEAGLTPAALVLAAAAAVLGASVWKLYRATRPV